MGIFKKGEPTRPSEEDLGKNIFTPMIYHGKTDPEFTRVAASVDRAEVIECIQTRVADDGSWCIDNDLVGPKPAGPEKMKGMVAFACNKENIMQAIDHPANDGATVDFICRDLANASKFNANASKAIES